MEYESTELLDYDTYLKTVRRRIQEINQSVDIFILISQIEIRDISSKVQEEPDKWIFRYRIEKDRAMRRKDTISGTIIHDNFETWKRKKITRIREQKLKQLGI